MQDESQQKPPAGEHPMVTFAQENASKLLCLVIWKAAKVYPDLSVSITGKDLAEFGRRFAQNGQIPVLAVEGMREAVKLSVVDETTGRMIISQKGDPNSPNAVMMRKYMETRKEMPKLRERVLTMIETTGSPRKKQLLAEVAEALRIATWEPGDEV